MLLDNVDRRQLSGIFLNLHSSLLSLRRRRQGRFVTGVDATTNGHSISQYASHSSVEHPGEDFYGVWWTAGKKSW